MLSFCLARRFFVCLFGWGFLVCKMEISLFTIQAFVHITDLVQHWNGCTGEEKKRCTVKNQCHPFALLPKLRRTVSTNLNLFSGSFWSVGIAPYLEEKSILIIILPLQLCIFYWFNCSKLYRRVILDLMDDSFRRSDKTFISSNVYYSNPQSRSFYHCK